MTQDLRLAVRRLAAGPGFAAVAVGTLALGIGANAAMFSVVRAVLLAPLPYQAPHELVRVVGFEEDLGEIDNLSPADFLDFAASSRTLAAMGAHGYVGSATIGGDDRDAERVGMVRVTDGFFPTLGVQPALGRLFVGDEDRPGARPVALISHGFWQRRFAAAPTIVGAEVTVNAQPHTVVGVLPATFRHLEENPDRSADVFLPFGFDRAAANRGGHFIRAVGRLAGGASIEAARAELVAIAARLQQEHPTTNHQQSVHVSPLHEAVVADARRSLLILAAAVGLVLLIACANLANLLLAAGAGRRREFAVRTALGADRGRLVRQLLAESLVLSGLGAVAGVGLALWSTRAATLLAAAEIPRTADIRVDGVVLAFVAVTAVASALLFGLAPAWHLSHGSLHEPLKEGGRSQVAAAPQRLRDLFMGAQVALAVVLLVGATLLVRSLWRLQDVPPGFAPSAVTAMDVSLPTAVYPEGSQVRFYERLEERVRALPGVERVGAINILPLSANYDSRGVQVEDHPRPEGQALSPQARSVTPGYFAAMGVPLQRGRLFDERDREDSPLVVVISATMARQYWPGEDPLGRRLTFNSGIPREAQQEVGGPGSREVVGIVGDVHHLALDEPEVPMFYTPHAQQPSYHTMTLVVRGRAEVAGLAAAARAELRQLDAGVPLYQVRTIDQVLARVVAQPRLRAGLLTLFALLAALLAALGVYGVVSYVVQHRTAEIGVRMALGASRRDVLAMLLGQGMRPVLAGVAAGLAGAWGLSRTLSALLFGVTAGDVGSYAVAAALLVTAALAATLVPAHRATSIDPAIALRGD
ncbi:MAG: ABC transporter permease [Vicinamibacterales bacterium]